MTSQTDPNARVAMNKMIINIYAPCMETPARDKYQSICAQNPQVNQNVCKCTANKIGMHMQQNGSQIFADILANNPTIEDPWAMLEKDPQFEAFKESAAKSCI